MSRGLNITFANGSPNFQIVGAGGKYLYAGAPGVITTTGIVTNFTSASGVNISSPSGASNGALVTITAPTGTFGTKPFSPSPLIWAPMDTQFNPSSLSRITSWVTTNPLSKGLTWQSTGGPTSAGCLSASTNAATGAAGVWTWTQGVDITQWSGWAAADPFGGGNGYYLNDYNQTWYKYFKMWRNFGHLDDSASNSYNGIGGYNAKASRDWSTTPIATTNAAQAAPDIYLPVNNGRYAIENVSTSGVVPTCIQDYPSNGSGTQWGTLTENAIISAENIQNTFVPHEMLFKTNSNSSTADANFNWRVPSAPTRGPYSLGSIYNFPITTYALIAYQYNNSAAAQTLAGNQRGTMTRLYPCHFIIDGTSGSHTAAPTGAYVQYADVYVDDSFCRVMATDSATWGSEVNLLEPQIPTAWTPGNPDSVTVSMHNCPIGAYLWGVNASNNATYLGQRIH